ncbi:MAG TPA: shikimate kinase [Candidatus Paceibacterota bacterium]|nr:shikimate kinase [Candidatus Paceibacterota bacterium]
MQNFKSKKGLTFIGMPSSGKSVTGRVLAPKLGCKYVDLDILIREKEGKHHDVILKEKGNEALKELEEKYTLELDFDGLIFAPPGSIIFSEKAMQKIKENSLVIYLDVSKEEIERRLGENLYKDGIIGLKEKGLANIILERLPLYKKYADLYLDTNGLKKEEVVEEVLKML